MKDYIYMYIYVGVIKRWILISIIEIKGSIIFFNTFKVTSNCLMIFLNFFFKKIRHNKIKLGVAKTTFYLRNHRRLFCILEHIAVSSIFSNFSVAFFSFVDELGDNLGSSEGHQRSFLLLSSKNHISLRQFASMTKYQIVIFRMIKSLQAEIFIPCTV